MITFLSVVLALFASPGAGDAGAGPGNADGGVPVVVEQPQGAQKKADEPPRHADGSMHTGSHAPAGPVVATSDSNTVQIQHLHTVLERKGDRVEVVEILTLVSKPGTVFRSDEGYLIERPKNAVSHRVQKDKERGLVVRAVDHGYLVESTIGPRGGDVTIIFEVPVINEMISVEHKLPSKVGGAQFISTWTRNNAVLKVEGSMDATMNTLENGLNALVANGRNMGPVLSFSLSGLDHTPEEMVRLITLLVSLALLAAGFLIWFKKKLASASTAPAGSTKKK